MVKLHLLLLVAVFGTSQAFEWVNGTCPDLDSVTKYLPGEDMLDTLVYERKSLNNFLFSEEGKCTTLFNSLYAKRGVISSIYEQINKDNQKERVFGIADGINDPEFHKKLIFNFRFFGDHLQPIHVQAAILATDQKNYAVTYSCKQVTDPHTQESKKLESAWVYTAQRGDTSFDEQIKSDIASLGLEYDSFKETDQSDCS